MLLFCMLKKKLKKKTLRIGQITVKRMGKKFLVCVSGDPKKIENYLDKAEREANRLRLKYGKRLKDRF